MKSVLVTVLLVLGGCVASPAMPLLTVPSEFERAEDVLGGSLAVRAFTFLTSIVGTERVTGSIMIPMSTKACESPLLGVLPYVTWEHREPRVGQLIEIEWQTLVIGAPRDWPAVVLCNDRGTRSMHPSGIEVDGVDVGSLGTLFVNLDGARWLAPGGEGAMLSRRPEDAGRIRLRWTPTQDQLGEVWYFHLVCFGLHPSIHPSGMLISPGLRVEIGSAP